MLSYHCRKVAKYYKHFLVIIILLIKATNWAPNISQELVLVLCINYIFPLVHTNPYFQDGGDKAQGNTVSLGQSQDASPGLPVTVHWGPSTTRVCSSSDTSHSLWKCNFCSADIFLH